MAAVSPLSHHEVLPLAAPFARRGLRTDLAASRREERRLVFRPAEGPHCYELHDLGGGRWRLLRRLAPRPGAVSEIGATGGDPDALLAALEAVPLALHAVEGEGYLIVRDYELADGRPVLVQGRVHLAGLVLTLSVPGGARLAASVVLEPTGGWPKLPEDLLAVLGWNWARLVSGREAWTSRLRLKARGAERTTRAEAALARAAEHLAQSLAAPPTDWHARHRAARWGVFLRRGIPSFTAIGLVGAVVMPASLDWKPDTATMLLLYHVPTLIVAVSFMLQELPRFEIPPWPRRLKAARWFPEA